MKSVKMYVHSYVRAFSLLFLTFFLFNCEDIGNAQVIPLPDRDVAVPDLEYNENAPILNFESEESFE